MNEWMKYSHFPTFLWCSFAKQTYEGKPLTCADEPTHYPYYSFSPHIYVFCHSLKPKLSAPNLHISISAFSESLKPFPISEC